MEVKLLRGLLTQLTTADKWLMGVVMALSLAGVATSWYNGLDAADLTAEISVDGKLVQTVPLRAGYRQDIRIGGEQQYDIIEVDDGKVRVREADCPDQDCIKMGWISRAPQQIVCLPYRIVIKVVAHNGQDLDGITR